MEQQLSAGSRLRRGSEIAREKAVKSAGRQALSVLGVMTAAAAISGCIVAGAYMALCAYIANGDTIWPGISVLNQDLSGLTVEEAAAKLDSLINDSRVEVYLYDQAAGPQSHDREPDRAYTFAELGFQPDTWQIAKDAYDLNVTDPEFHTLGWRFLTGEGETVFAPLLELDEDQVRARAGETAAAMSYPKTDTAYTLKDTTLSITLPTDGRTVEAENIVEKVMPILAHSPEFAVDVPYTVLHHDVVTAQEIRDEIYLPTKNASYDKKSRSVVAGQVGRDFDVPTVQAAMDAAAPGSTIQMSVTLETPAITYSQLQAVLFRDELGTASTHVGGTAARISNVKLAASAINGAVLNAGETFSYNGTVGQRTVAKGYQPAPAYVQGQTVDEIGGGVCQPSSTLYLACLRSNMKITERYAHRYIPAYIQAGMDATVSWGGPDYKFTNNTPYPVKILTGYANGYLTVTLVGTKTDNTHVEMTNEFLGKTDWKTVYQTDPTLPVGTTKVVTTPYTGYKYNTYRNIYDGNGKLISSKFEALSDYKVRDQVIARNPG